MWEAAFAVLAGTATAIVLTQIFLVATVTFGIYEYITLRVRLKGWCQRKAVLQTASPIRRMEVDKLVDLLLDEEKILSRPVEEASLAGTADCKKQSATQATGSPPAGMTPVADASGKRDELAAVALGGKSRLYLGRALTHEQIDAMPDDEIGKLYSRYQMRLGAVATHSLGKGILQIYGRLVSLWRPWVDQTGLVSDLEANPFVEHSLSVAASKAYHRVGLALAPLSVALITLQHCSAIEPECPPIVEISKIEATSNQADGATNSSESTQPQTSRSG